jgi:tetratricopeptide (TPR) repeat protein
MARQMLTPQIPPVGLGPFLGEFKNPEEFGHTGGNEGFRCVLIMLADAGKGVVVMTNSDAGLDVAYPVIDSIAKEYGWNYTPDPPTASDLLMLLAMLKGPEATIARYSELKKAGSASPYHLDENTLIGIGYHFLSANQNDAAIQIFKLEVDDNPKFWNAYDSLGEAFLKVGQKDLAIANYEKSVELNPMNQGGIDALKKIRGQK